MQLAHRRRRVPRQRRARPGDKSLGAVLVEAAFVTPVFFTLIFGIIEIGLAMNDNLALAHSVRAGTRVASASGDDLYADYGVIQAIKRESTALPNRAIQLVVIYEATAYGEKPSQTCRDGNDSTATGKRCNAYKWDDLDDPKTRYGCNTLYELDKAFCPTLHRDVIAAGGTTYVGVWMKVEHRWVTGMFGRTVTLTDSSVIRLEPRQQ